MRPEQQSVSGLCLWHPDAAGWLRPHQPLIHPSDELRDAVLILWGWISPNSLTPPQILTNLSDTISQVPEGWFIDEMSNDSEDGWFFRIYKDWPNTIEKAAPSPENALVLAVMEIKNEW